MAVENSSAANSAERELVITRIFDAPRSIVFKAWIDPEHKVRWLGPKGFTGKVIKMEVRPGGAYRFHMRSPEGTDHWQQGVYREVIEPQRLVMTYVWTDSQGKPTRPETLLTLTFEDLGGKTRLTLHQALFESVTACEQHRSGWSSSLDRLADFLTARVTK